MKFVVVTLALLCGSVLTEDVRLLDLEPTDAQQYIDKQDTTLKYAPKIESNVPAVRYLGNEPHDVQEDIYLANQYHGQDGLGGYLYGYSVPDIAKTEKKIAGGDLRGAYQYIAGNGQEIKVEYWDDGTGFHQVDNVPKVLPQQIEDTPELKAAKEEHLRIWQEQAERNSKPIQSPFDTHSYNALSAQGQEQAKQQLLQYQQNQQAQQVGQLQQYQSHAQYKNLPPPQTQPQYQPQVQQQYKPQQYQAQQLVNQYQQSKQQYPNPGQSIQYQGDQSNQYQAQQTQVKQYQAAKPQAQTQQQQVKQIPAPAQYQAPQPLPLGQSQVQGNQAAQTQQHQVKTQQIQAPGQYQAQPQSQVQGNQAAQTQQYQVKTQQIQAPGQYQAQPLAQAKYQGQGQFQSQQYQGQSQQQSHQGQSNDNDDGEYRETDEGEYKETNEGEYVPGEGEEQGPPRGFFYNFDYPVGIIVSKDGQPVQQPGAGDVKDVYASNKANFEQQLHGQARPARSSTGYLYVH